jgi:aspartyl protease family protein
MNFNSLQNNDWQQLIYLLVLLAVILISVSARKNFAYSKLFKALGIWGFVVLVCIILYSYRFEFSDFKNRVLGEINPSSARFAEGGRLVINLSQDGHFYLNTKINGTAVRFMIDTGASDIVLNKSDAIRAGIDLKNLRFNRVYQTANGRSFGASTILDELEVGGVKFYRVNASVNDADMGTSLLGMSFLRRFRKYEFYQDKLVLEI